MAREVGFGSKAAVGEARSVTNQAVLYGCTPVIAVHPNHRDRLNSDTRMPLYGPVASMTFASH